MRYLAILLALYETRFGNVYQILLSMGFYLPLPLFQGIVVKLWLLQLLQMICFGNRSSRAARFWQLPQYIENSWQKYIAWTYLSVFPWVWFFFFPPFLFLFFSFLFLFFKARTESIGGSDPLSFFCYK